MAFHFKLFSVCLLVAVLSTGKTWGITNLISGNVTNNTTWSGTNLLQGTVTILSNAVVSIDPGAWLLMSTAATLRVEGQLLANGTSNQPITFTRSTATTNWGRIIFVRAADSLLRHCVIEFANCIGDHKAYYDNDCNPATPPPPRTYFQAVVAVACHLDLDGCVFQNLPDSTIPSNRATEKGDAIAIISDDPNQPGNASATIRNCRFIRIGQGVHTRYSYVLVENCYFTGHFGDNDDVDLYGESIPPPLVRSNVFLLAHDDFINPTRCSAIITDNLLVGDTTSGGTDHGIVLRDASSPIVANNVIYNCPSAGLSVQNQCSALLVNNTVVNCGIGVRFVFHSDRLGPPYCLANAGARATLINCLIWDCPTSISMNETDDPGSRTTVIHSDIEGGQGSIAVAGNSSFSWGNGNINADPLFANPSTNNYHLRVTSPCIDGGTNVSAVISITNRTGAVTNLSFPVSKDYDGIPRPLDGNGDGLTRFDIGAYEYLLATADSNGDGIPDGWTWSYGLNPTDPDVASGNPDGDPHTTFEEWVTDTNPTNGFSYFRLSAVSNVPPLTVYFASSSNRLYTLFCTTNLADANVLSAVPGQIDVPGNGATRTLTDTNVLLQKFYSVGVKVP